jgi:prevent-host-death family protein
VAGRLTRASRCGHHDHMPRHTIVGARELKTRLGGYLQRVRQGRTIVITDRGQPVAELRPLASAGTEEAVLDRLTAIGAVTRLEHRPLAPFQPIASRGRSLSLAIIEDRDDRV